MTSMFALALGASGIVITVLIHYLNRGARKQMTVANPALYADVAAPRLVLIRLTQRALLLVRCALLICVFFGAIVTMSRAPSGGSIGVTQAVVPGTPEPAWQPVVDDTHAAVWLDSALTPIDMPPISEFSMASLRALDSQLRPDLTLTVIGALPARQWPRRGFAMMRDVIWMPVPAVRFEPAQRATPPSVVVVVEAPALTAELEPILSLWRSAGVVATAQLQQASELSVTADSWLLVIGNVPTLPLRARDAVTVVLPADGLATTMSQDTLGARATHLWQQLSALPASVPGNGHFVSGSPFVRIPQIAQRLSPETSDRKPRWWLLMVAVLFATERWLSLRARSAQ